MPKTCSHPDCAYNVFSKGLCQIHWRQVHGKPIPKKVPPVASNKARGVIKKVSDKQLLRLAEYRKVRDKFLKDNPVCQYPNCASTDVTLHHSRGRIGALLLDVRHFRSLCWQHHSLCENEPLEAQKLGLSAKRLDNGKR